MVSDLKQLAVCRKRIAELEAAMERLRELHLQTCEAYEATLLGAPFAVQCVTLPMTEMSRQQWLEGREQYLDEYLAKE